MTDSDQKRKERETTSTKKRQNGSKWYMGIIIATIAVLIALVGQKKESFGISVVRPRVFDDVIDRVRKSFGLRAPRVSDNCSCSVSDCITFIKFRCFYFMTWMLTRFQLFDSRVCIDDPIQSFISF